MKNNLLIIVFTFATVLQLVAQPRNYTVTNAHSHNDYEQAIPFWLAYQAGFGSIEVDIFLKNGELYVAHNILELQRHRTLEQYYLQPLMQCLKEGKGYPFIDTSLTLQLLIDIKTDAVATLQKLVEKLSAYPVLRNQTVIRWVISGNIPAPEHFQDYPPFIWFDGDARRSYPSEALSKIALLSTSFRKISYWRGTDSLSAIDNLKLKQLICTTHQLQKPIRFWATPDKPIAWNTLMQLGVDYINTDHIAELASELNKIPLNRIVEKGQKTSLNSSCACNVSTSYMQSSFGSRVASIFNKFF
ncbi:MAG: hypothetical protein NVSMB63_01100 [Sediminibacterium sp.]